MHLWELGVEVGWGQRSGEVTGGARAFSSPGLHTPSSHAWNALPAQGSRPRHS